jgi:predicted NAD/FAD-binding protein
MSKDKEELTTSQVADRLKVKPVTVRKWLAENLFPNARREDTPRGAVWYIPVEDVNGFVKPTRGRPFKDKDNKN